MLFKQPTEVAQIGKTQPVSHLAYGMSALFEQKGRLFHPGLLVIIVNGCTKGLLEKLF